MRTENELKQLKQGIAFVAVLVILGSAIVGGVVWKQHSERIEKEAVKSAALAANAKKRQETDAVKASVLGPEKPMVKIAAGTTGIVTVTNMVQGQDPVAGGGMAPDHFRIDEDGMISTPNGGTQAVGDAIQATWASVPEQFSTNGVLSEIYNVNCDVTVKVPAGAAPGVRGLRIASLDDNGNNSFGNGFVQFEVVCMKVTLRLVPSETTQ